MKPTDFQALIFDMDGTIVNTVPTVLDCLKKALAETGAKFDAKKLTSTLIGPPLEQMIKTLCPAESSEKRAEVVAAFRRFYDAAPEKGTELFRQIVPLLQTSVRKFIATNKPQKPALRLLDALEISPLFEAVLTSDSGLSKAQMIAKIVAENGLNPEKTLMIGDAVSDMTAAHAAGVKACAVVWGYEQDKDRLWQIADFVWSEQ